MNFNEVGSISKQFSDDITSFTTGGAKICQRFYNITPPHFNLTDYHWCWSTTSVQQVAVMHLKLGTTCTFHSGNYNLLCYIESETLVTKVM